MFFKKKKPSKYELRHWDIFNKFSKIVGWNSIVCGSIFTLSVLGDPEWYGGDKIAIIFLFSISMVFVLFGVLLVKTGPHYPKHIKKYLEDQKAGLKDDDSETNS